MRTFLILSALTLCAFARSEDAKTLDLGVALRSVYFEQGSTRPAVGIDVDHQKFKLALQDAAKGDIAEIRKLFLPENIQKSVSYWNVYKVYEGTNTLVYGTDASQVFRLSYSRNLILQLNPKDTDLQSEIKNPFLLVLYQDRGERESEAKELSKAVSAQRENPGVLGFEKEKKLLEEEARRRSIDPWGRYHVTFDFAGYAAKVLGNTDNVADLTLEHRTEADIKAKQITHLRRSGTANLSFESSLTPAKTNLITGKWVDKDSKGVEDGVFKWQNREARGSIVNLEYKDVMFRLPTDNSISRVGEMVATGALSDYPIDSRSYFQVQVGGVTRTAFGGSVDRLLFSLRTSQSLSRTDLFIEHSLRWNDRRGGNMVQGASKKFFSEAEASRSATFDFGYELGGTVVKPLANVDLRSDPFGEKVPKVFVRPFGRVNLFEDSILGGQIQISGTVQAWYLGDKISGVQSDTRIAERATLKFAHKNGRFNFNFSVTAGRNPASSFEKIIPTYGFGLKVSF